ncbi:MAG TPA: TIGR03435 family protein [Bryobacteraceae bacterium]|nr:TIGR03435 family protein [Bryobacteraceae bacterium]
MNHLWQSTVFAGAAALLALALRSHRAETRRPMMDETGAKGLFEIDTPGWAPMRQQPPRVGEPSGGDEGLLDPTRPTLFSVFEHIGLKIEVRKAPVETFTIEHVEMPSEN